MSSTDGAYIEEQFEVVLRPIEVHLTAALVTLEKLETLTLQRRAPALQLASTHHYGYLRGRLQDIRIILGRIVEAKHAYVYLEGEHPASQAERCGVPDSRLLAQITLDFESLYIFGNLALDQWVMLVNAITGEPPNEKSPDFHRLIMTLQAKEYAGRLLPVWKRHRNDIV